MIEATIHYAVIDEILGVLSSGRSPEEKNQAILLICEPIAVALQEKLK